MNKLAKKAAIIMVMPSPVPMFGPPCMEAIEFRAPPPVQPRVALPTPLPPPPPMLTPPGIPVPTMCAPVMPPQSVALPAPPRVCCPCPAAPTCYPCPTPITDEAAAPSKADIAVETCLQLMGLASDLSFLMRTPSMPSFCESVFGIATDLYPFVCPQNAPPGVAQSPACAPSCGKCVLTASAPMCHSNCGLCGSIVAAGQPTFGYYEVASSAPLANVRIIAMPSSEELEMNVGGPCITCIRSKKMSIKIGENEITLSRFDDRVRVRGDELKATACSVCSNSKDRLILEGDVVLHYKKDGHSANVTGDRIELNLCSGSVTIRGAKTISHPAVHIERIDSDRK